MLQYNKTLLFKTHVKTREATGRLYWEARYIIIDHNTWVFISNLSWSSANSESSFASIVSKAFLSCKSVTTFTTANLNPFAKCALADSRSSSQSARMLLGLHCTPSHCCHDKDSHSSLLGQLGSLPLWTVLSLPQVQLWLPPSHVPSHCSGLLELQAAPLPCFWAAAAAPQCSLSSSDHAPALCREKKTQPCPAVCVWSVCCHFHLLY